MKGWQILITGGSSGIGWALAQALHADGAIVHLGARGQVALNSAAEPLGERVHTYVCDTSDRLARQAMVAALSERTGGRLDGLVVNAAMYAYTPLLDEDDDHLLEYFRVNTLPAFALVKLCRPLLLAGEGRSVLFVSSTLATRPVPGVGAYAASKAAMTSLAKSFALELAPERMRVNALLPGVVNTPIHDPQTPEDPRREDKLAMLAQAHPLGRVGEPEDVARAARYLLSAEAGWVTGSLFYVDGGISLV